ncbi:MAG: GtrA family protein [Prevotellaceae bacterium]|jgi:putative flippase GtrA|nr:GtrA family protein [Prevotellaceae bacterium]
MFKQLIIFFKTQLSAFTGGLCDYGIMIFLTEIAGLHYTLSIAVACILGAVVNFAINRSWSFYSQNRTYKFSSTQQLIRFTLVLVGSIFLKSSGTFLLTALAGIDYKISRIITDIIVSLGYNYVLQRFWVFTQAKDIKQVL